MSYWIWSIDEANWDIVKKKHLFASSKLNVTTKIKKNDQVIFYVKKTGLFRGIFKIKSQWYRANKPIWADEKRKIRYSHQCELDEIILGDAVFEELINQFTLKIHKAVPHFVLRNSRSGPAYYGKPIPDKDFYLIYEKMKDDTSISQDDYAIESRHEAIISDLELIGQTLGFDTYSDKPNIHVATGCEVDVIWETRIANIGKIKYVFEVQHKGSIKSAINNLIVAINNPLVKKVIIVTDKKQSDKAKEQVEQIKSLADTTKAMFVYLDIKNVKDFTNILDQINEFKGFFGLS